MKQEERNKAERLQACPERTAEPALCSLLPSGLCLAFGTKNSPPAHLLFPRGKIDFINQPTPESNRGFFGGWWRGKEPSRGSAGAELCFPTALASRRTRNGAHRDSPSFQAGWWRVLDASLSSRSRHGATTKGQNAPLSKGKLRPVAVARVSGFANTPPLVPCLVYWWIGNVWLALHLEESWEGEADPKEPPSSIPGSVSPLPVCFPLLPALQSVLLSPQAHQQELLFFHNRILHVRTSRGRAGGGVCTCQDE